MNKTVLVHVLAKAGIFALCVVLDVLGKLSPHTFGLALAAIGAVGLTSAVSAFRSSGASEVEREVAQALGAIVAKELDRAFGEHPTPPQPTLPGVK